MSTGHTCDTVEYKRAEMVDGEPIITREHIIRSDGSAFDSPVVNTTAKSREILSFYPGKKVSVEVFSDRVVIRRVEEDG